MKKLHLLLVACLITIFSFGQSGTTGPLTWSITNDILTISGTGAMPDYTLNGPGVSPWFQLSTIKQVIIEDGVSSIGIGAFVNCRGIVSVTIPNSVTSIGDNAFVFCKGISSLTIPNSVISIGNSAFAYCHGIISLTLPNSVTRIGVDAFNGCEGITSLAIPNSITRIQVNAFYGCSGITSLTIPNSVTYIERSAFYGCYGITSLTLPNSLTSIGESVFYGCFGISSLTLSDSLTSIGNSAFAYCHGITSLTIPNSLTSIGPAAFKDCSGLTSVTIPNSVTSIEPAAFKNCIGLTSITLPNSVTSIDGAFYGCSGITSLTIPDSVTSIGNYAFYGCSGITSLSIPNSVTSIGSSAFYRCFGISSLTIPNSVISIGNSAFYGCTGITSLSIPNSVTSIGSSAFYRCFGISSLTIPNSVTSIGANAFYGCSGLKDIYAERDAPATCVDNTFANMNKTDCILHVPANSKQAYSTASGWKDFTLIDDGSGLGGTTGPLTWSIDNDILTISGTGAMPDYNDSKHPWSSTIKQVIVGDSVTSIGNFAFYGCRGITSLTLPNSLTSIGNFAFANCSGITSLTIPNSVTSIGNSAFYQSSGISSITIPNSVTSIGVDAFWGCTGLQDIYAERDTPPTCPDYTFSTVNKTTCILHVPANSSQSYSTAPGWKDFIVIQEGSGQSGTAGPLTWSITNDILTISGTGAMPDYNGTYRPWPFTIKQVIIEDGVSRIGSKAFYNYKGISSLTIPNSVTSIGDFAFYDCIGIISVTIPNSVTSIGNAAFEGCEGITSLTIPNTVTSIGNYAFNGCRGISSLTIPDSVTSIGDFAFSECSGLSSLTIPNSVTRIGNMSFYGCSGLKNIYTESIVPAASFNNTFTNVNKTDCILHVPANSKQAYSIATGWKDFTLIDDGSGQSGTTGLLSVSSPQLEIGKEEASTATSIVTSNTSWAATSNQDWLTVSPASGAGNATLTFTTKQNTAVAQRTATVILAATGANPVTITITQQAEDALLSVSSPQLEIGKEEASTATSIVTSNTSWTATSNQDWLTVSPASGTGNVTLTFTTKQNTAVAERTATVTVAATGTNPVSITITQQPEDAFIIAAQSLPLNGGIVTGVGEYARNATVSLQAMSNDQYEFKGWREGTTIISDAITFNFTAIVSRTLYAVFTPKENADTSMTITPQSSSASFLWSPINGAINYLLIIYSDAACTQELAHYQLDAAGKIINKSASTTETSASTILSCTVDGLASGKIYYYLLTSYDSNSQTLSVSSGNFTTLITGINEVEVVVPKVYPSPTTGMVYIEATNNKSPSIKVYNLQGRVLLQTQGNEVDLSDCANGMYILHIDGQTIKVEKK